jgi:Asp-tRNA(Asn)/Glu-tRNA(Gln) amidotransferase A subunit family amidase
LFKPTKGWFSTTGLIPACRTLDVISIFALTVDDAWTVAQMMQGFDETDAYSRRHPENVPVAFSGKIAIPAQLEFYGDELSRHVLTSRLNASRHWVIKLRALILQFSINWQTPCITVLGGRTHRGGRTENKPRSSTSSDPKDHCTGRSVLCNRCHAG